MFNLNGYDLASHHSSANVSYLFHTSHHIMICILFPSYYFYVSWLIFGTLYYFGILLSILMIINVPYGMVIRVSGYVDMLPFLIYILSLIFLKLHLLLLCIYASFWWWYHGFRLYVYHGYSFEFFSLFLIFFKVGEVVEILFYFRVISV